MNSVSNLSQQQCCSFDRESYTKNNSIPDEFICPLTLNIMRDPVMIKSGHSFERSAIFNWLQKGHDTCPLTRQPLGISGLVTNHALLVQIQKWKASQQDPSSYETDDETDSCFSTDEDDVAYRYGLARKVVIRQEATSTQVITTEGVVVDEAEEISPNRRRPLIRFWRTRRNNI